MFLMRMIRSELECGERNTGLDLLLVQDYRQEKPTGSLLPWGNTTVIFQLRAGEIGAKYQDSSYQVKTILHSTLQLS